MSHIKGGGRAPLTEEAEQALISLLLKLRQPTLDLSNSSDHDRKREHKRFVKQLVARHERQALAKQFQRSETSGSSENSISATTKAGQVQTLKQASGESNPGDGGTRKVRLELVEANFTSSGGKSSSKEKGNGKKKGKSSKDDSTTKFKEGAKKVMVFSSTTSIEDVLKEAKSKLRMKKKPIRCFVVEKKHHMDLTNDLQGVPDGSKVYVTSDANLQVTENNEDKAKPNESNGMPQEEDDDVDPLIAVKQVYLGRRHNKSRDHRHSKPLGEHPRFQDYFHQLPPISTARSELPAAACRETILRELDDDQRVLIVCGATGSGKSTQVPQFLLEGMVAAGQAEAAHILVSQPRRVACTSLAMRVAQERESPPPGKAGAQVGYNVRLDRAITPTTKIVYCTVGILLRMLVCPRETTDDFVEEGIDNDNNTNDATTTNRAHLSNVSHVVIDEVHERDVNTDFVLTLLRNILKINPHLRVILMSATASAQLFLRYFEEVGMKPSIVEIPGRTFPVDIKWIGDCEQFASSGVQGWSPKLLGSDDRDVKNNLSPRAMAKIDNNFIRDLIRAIVHKQQRDGDLQSNDSLRKNGAILVFLPGKNEIEALARTIYQDPTIGDRELCNVLKLHSTVPRAEQQSVFQPAKGGTVKICLATNIAETSITIPDVSHVIDTGRVKESRFNASSRIKELVTVWTSQASAKQRAGRAGRTTAGICWRLYSEEFSSECLPLQTSPEISRTPLDELVMQLCLLFEHRRDQMSSSTNKEVPKGVCPIRFLNNTPEPPPPESLVEACKHLLEVGAITIVCEQPSIIYRLTPMGYHLSRLPTDAKIGKVLLVGCMLGCLENALTVAAALSNTKSCFPSKWNSVKQEQWDTCIDARKNMVEKGFGGPNWHGGTVKGDLIATITAFREWQRRRSDKERFVFCNKHGIDNTAMKELSSLRAQFRDYLKDADFIPADDHDSCNDAVDDALLTSCCLVAGLYPNICTLMRPRRGGPKGGRLITKEGDLCRPSMGSFQSQRIRNASENGKDAYAVFHAKHRSIGTNDRPGEVFLSEVDFISRFALLLFGGELEVEKNALIVDGWLKFKVGDKGTAGAVLIQELRSEVDNLMLQHIGSNRDTSPIQECGQSIIMFIRQLLANE